MSLCGEDWRCFLDRFHDVIKVIGEGAWQGAAFCLSLQGVFHTNSCDGGV